MLPWSPAGPAPGTSLPVRMCPFQIWELYLTRKPVFDFEVLPLWAAVGEQGPDIGRHCFCRGVQPSLTWSGRAGVAAILPFERALFVVRQGRARWLDCVV